MNLRETSSELARHLGDLLKEARLEAGLSANRLGELTGLNRQAITFIERGDRIPSVENFSRLALALGKVPSKLWEEAEGRLK